MLKVTTMIAVPEDYVHVPVSVLVPDERTVQQALSAVLTEAVRHAIKQEEGTPAAVRVDYVIDPQLAA